MNKIFSRVILSLPVLAHVLFFGVNVGFADEKVFDGDGTLVGTKNTAGTTTYYNTPE